ncbi:hypothetical protein NEUTE1DRAFT_103302 [Neurospora tetrasperma FGSC 2508]|uniref:Uncharacterized protein n=1 Tax=Neurospora tetrasperma (strain FGSC 2508 / ATCC MYA-4615 / P0657) TaxID=510951 RepID=F8MSG9_NEUT8|nr:uncharacterized protein NEUTE1DRAFT_103302 [Neurospora tetrasperma FGSC 2508]EGO55909.1 hypothetical protein NEUTE1DRAFT_103302 [Neurospora tetrasperma FGSC 2508]EGZ67554.1 hypothetical protein NEUTE2DRAFT_133456 [Neurospora tetrasperma FGSC 2509]
MACDAKESMALDKVVKTLMPRLAGIRRNMMVIEIHLVCDIAISIGLVGSKSPQGLGRRAKPLTTRSAGWQIQRQGNANNGRQPSRDPNPSVQPHTK